MSLLVIGNDTYIISDLKDGSREFIGNPHSFRVCNKYIQCLTMYGDDNN